MRRFVRSAVSFAIILVAYWAYALVAVPLIEPPADEAGPGPTVGGGGTDTRNDVQLRALAQLFPPGSWELNSPIVLENDQFMMLVRDYRNLQDGRVELRPCTFVLLPNTLNADLADRAREAVVLQAPHGAVVTFDRPMNITRPDVGRIVAGQLNGVITIRSEGKTPAPDDNLIITTRDVQMNEQQVWTPHAVDFQWGLHHGRGQQMRMKLQQGESRGGAPRIAGVELFELAHVERLHLEMGGAPRGKPAATPVATVAAQTAPPPAARGGFFRPRNASDSVPLEITCRGPFRCDMGQQIATFEEQVNVWRINPTGPADQLSCELLMIEFMDRPAKGSKVATAANDEGKPKPQSFNLAAERIEARGNPVVLNAPSEQLNARGQRLEYHVVLDRITLDGNEECYLKQGSNEIRGMGLQYKTGPQGGLGEVHAGGPGWLRAQPADRPDEIAEARWGEQLHLRPHEGNHLLSLTGGSQLTYHNVAQLTGNEIHFWLSEAPGDKPGKTTLRPERMLARKDVRIDSEQLSGAVGQMEVWFEQAAAMPGRRPPPRTTRGAPIVPIGPATVSPQPHYALQVQDESPWMPAAETDAPPEGSDWTPDQPTVRPASLAPAPNGAAPVAPPLRRQHFDVAGNLLRARVLLRLREQAELTELVIEENVRLVETLTAQPNEKPMLVTGDMLHVVDAMQPYAAVTVTGRPAHFEARGLGLTGSNINLNRGTNRLWIEGAGWMDLPMDRDVNGQPLAKPGTLRVDWQRKMEFDGTQARFDEGVIASTPTLNVRTEALKVQFQKPINFANANARQDAQVEEIICNSGVLMENRTFKAEQQVSYDRMQVSDLAMNARTGTLFASGPGWLTSVRRAGAGDDEIGVSLPLGDRSKKPSAPHADTGLRGLHVRFQGSITGNMHQRAMQFNNQVTAAFAPVSDWNVTVPIDQPETLGPQGAVLTCDQLGVNQVVVPMSDRRAMELAAAGNVVVEGQDFTARAARMTYAEAKDLLVFEGDGRSDADLYRQQQVGGERSHVGSRKILYWPKTKKLWIDGARSLELSGLPAAPVAPRKP